MSGKDLAVHPEWSAWLAENLARGCERKVLVETLLANGFSRATIERALARPVLGTATPGSVDVRDAPVLKRPDNGRFVLKLNSSRLELFLIEDFLDATECAGLIAAGESRLRPSTITVETPDNYFRTSRTCDLGLLDAPIVRTISDRICDTLGIDAMHAEVMQLQKYAVGEQFKAHTDYFEPGTEEYAEFCTPGGNRTWTFMIYLSQVERGGGTHFLAIDRTIQPRPGMAVVWNNLRPDARPNPETLHAGTPVEAGTKYIVTQWFRERPIATPNT